MGQGTSGQGCFLEDSGLWPQPGQSRRVFIVEISRGNSDGGNSLNQERHEERKEKCLKEHNTRETGVCGQVYLTTRPGSGTWTCSLGSGESRKVCIGLSGV